jgi:hypothetical protein
LILVVFLAVERREKKSMEIIEGSQITRQFVTTPAAGKRLIARALAVFPVVQNALKSNRVVIVAGTTNGYVAEEILTMLGGNTSFSRLHFFRGIILPPGRITTGKGRLPDESAFPGDVVLNRGVWEKGKTIFDVVDDLKEGDVILKGANALEWTRKRAAILIGDRKAGTIGAALQAVIGRRVQLILPVGLEKRVIGNLDDLASRLNAPEVHGPRLLPVQGLVFTEIDAIHLLTGAVSELVAAGGVCGAEGSVWLAVSGTVEEMERVETLLRSVGSEPPFES